MTVSPTLKVTYSPELATWLLQQQLSLGFTTYQTNRLFLVGVAAQGQIALHERLFDKPMGLYATDSQLYMSTRYQIWRFDDRLGAGETYQGSDRLYVPSISYTTGNLNVHDVVADIAQKLLFVNTDFSCLATVQPGCSFVPLWKPPFISKLAAEDRCHLNGLAIVEGQPTYMTACSATDTAAGWRNCRQDGGIVLHLPSNEIMAANLSMPHSPRWYRNKLWLLNSGTGELGYIDGDQFQPIIFCPGFVRGLAFWRNYAIVGLSKLRSANFTGLALETKLAALGKEPQCGLMVVDLDSGQIAHWLHVDGAVEELFDIVVLPGVRNPQALGFQGEDIERLITFPGSGGIVTSKPTVVRPSIGEAPPIPGLPTQERLQLETQAAPMGNGPVKFQQVYHLNPENLAPYDGMTFPSLQKRWRTKPRRGELVGVSASISGDMVGLAVAELFPDSGAELLSLFVLPACRRRGIGTQLLVQLGKALKQENCPEAAVMYQVSSLTQEALEPMLSKLGWQPPRQTFLLMQTTTEQISRAPWLGKYPLGEGFGLFPWPELTPDDGQQLQQLDFPPPLSPLSDMKRLEPLNSLGLRHRGQLVGWMVTHRVGPDTIRYSSLFVAEKFRARGRGIALLSAAIQRQIASPATKYTFAVAPESVAMLRFVRRHLRPYLTGVSESRQARIFLK